MYLTIALLHKFLQKSLPSTVTNELPWRPPPTLWPSILGPVTQTHVQRLGSSQPQYQTVHHSGLCYCRQSLSRPQRTPRQAQGWQINEKCTLIAAFHNTPSRHPRATPSIQRPSANRLETTTFGGVLVHNLGGWMFNPSEINIVTFTAWGSV